MNLCLDFTKINYLKTKCKNPDDNEHEINISKFTM